MPARRKPALIAVYIRRADGIIQRYKVRGRARAAALENRETRATFLREKSLRARAKTAARRAAKIPPPGADTVTPRRDPATPATPRRGPARPAPESFRRLRGAEYRTLFKAVGTMGSEADLTGTDSPDLFEADDDAPAYDSFYSNVTLGRVYWDGIEPLERLIKKLNRALQFVENETKGFDFRKYYRFWSYRYAVFERIGGVTRTMANVERNSGME